MEVWHFVWLLAAAAGVVSAGIAGSGWELATGRRPSIYMLASYCYTTPLRIMVIVIYAPLGVLRAGLTVLSSNPILALPVIGIGLGWSFLQGVFILTTFFGFS